MVKATVLETIKAIDKLISLYNELCEHKIIFMSSSGYTLRSNFGICCNLELIISESTCRYKLLPQEFNDAAKDWAMKFSPSVLVGNVFDSNYWLNGQEEYWDSKYDLMTNPLRLHAMIYIRNYLTQFVGQ